MSGHFGAVTVVPKCLRSEVSWFRSVLTPVAWVHDDWVMAVLGRIQMCSDLVAADAIYHLTCHTRFCDALTRTAGKVLRGRWVNQLAQNVFDKVCDKLESSCERGLYTLRHYRDEKTNIASDLKRNDPLLLSNHLFYAFCITLLVKIDILKLVQRLVIAYLIAEITNQFMASHLLLLRYVTAILAVMSCFFVCSPSSEIGRSPLKGCESNCRPGGK